MTFQIIKLLNFVIFFKRLYLNTLHIGTGTISPAVKMATKFLFILSVYRQKLKKAAQKKLEEQRMALLEAEAAAAANAAASNGSDSTNTTHDNLLAKIDTDIGESYISTVYANCLRHFI